MRTEGNSVKLEGKVESGRKVGERTVVRIAARAEGTCIFAGRWMGALLHFEFGSLRFASPRLCCAGVPLSCFGRSRRSPAESALCE